MPAETVTQELLYNMLVECGTMTAEDLAITVEQHPITVLRKLDGLVYQDKVRRVGRPFSPKAKFTAID